MFNIVYSVSISRFSRIPRAKDVKSVLQYTSAVPPYKVFNALLRARQICIEVCEEEKSIAAFSLELLVLFQLF